MHIRQLRELAVKVRELKIENADLMRYFTGKIKSLCKAILRDCCIQLTSSPKDAERAASSEDHAKHLDKISHDTASKYQQMCSSSEEYIAKNFLAFVPHLIQDIKAIFREQMIPVEQNGLWGLPKDTLDRMASQLKEAEKNSKTRQLVCEVCKILEELCLNNYDSQHPTDLIRKWGESLGIWSMLEFLKPFFQKSPEDVRLHKRLELFSRCTRDIMSDAVNADQVSMFGFSFSLIHFAKFDPVKVVRFELTGSPVTSSDCLKYDRHNDTFSQQFYFRKDVEGELLLRAVACVHVNGRDWQHIGAFKSVIALPVSEEKTFDTYFEICKTRVGVKDIAVKKVDADDSQNIQVVLCSVQKLRLSSFLEGLRKEPELQDVVDWNGAQPTPCPLTVRTVDPTKPETGVSLRLIYKWKSEAVLLDSEDFVAYADPSTENLPIPEVRCKGMLNLLWLNMPSIYTHSQTCFNVKGGGGNTARSHIL